MSWRDNYNKIKAKKAEHTKYTGIMTAAERQKSVDDIAQMIEAHYGYISQGAAQELLDKADALSRAWKIRDAALKAEASTWNGQEYLTAGMAVNMKLSAALSARDDAALYGKQTRAELLEKAINEAALSGKYAKRALCEEIETLQNTGKLRQDDINSRARKALDNAQAEINEIRYTPLLKQSEEMIEQRRADFIKTFDDVRAAEKDLTGYDPLDPLYQTGEVAITFKRIKFDEDGRPAVLDRDDSRVTNVYLVKHDGSGIV